jgi:O-methyltransferase involved in polyketide biosynthesis
VAYISRDQLVLLHASAVLKDDGLTAVDADPADAGAVLADEGLRQVIDLDEPVGLVLGHLLPFMGPRTARALIAAYAERVVPGSWVIACTPWYPSAWVTSRMEEVTGTANWSHGPAAVAKMMTGLTLIPPGITSARHWVARLEEPPPVSSPLVWCAAGIKRASLPSSSSPPP